MAHHARSSAAANVDAWRASDFAAPRALLVVDVGFDGPLAQIHGADGCVAGRGGCRTS
jgi:hypothetical protein